MTTVQTFRESILEASNYQGRIRHSKGTREQTEPYVALSQAYRELEEQDQSRFEHAVVAILAAHSSSESHGGAQDRLSELQLLQVTRLLRALQPNGVTREAVRGVALTLHENYKREDGSIIAYTALQALLSTNYRHQDFWKGISASTSSSTVSLGLSGLASCGMECLLEWLRTTAWSEPTTAAICNILPALYDTLGSGPVTRVAVIALRRTPARDRGKLLEILEALELNPRTFSQSDTIDELALYFEQFLRRGSVLGRDELRAEVDAARLHLERGQARGLVDRAIRSTAERWRTVQSEPATYTLNLLLLLSLSTDAGLLTLAFDIGFRSIDNDAPQQYVEIRSEILRLAITVLADSVPARSMLASAQSRSVKGQLARLLRISCKDKELARSALTSLATLVSAEEFVQNMHDALRADFVQHGECVSLIATAFDLEDAQLISLQLVGRLRSSVGHTRARALEQHARDVGVIFLRTPQVPTLEGEWEKSFDRQLLDQAFKALIDQQAEARDEA